MSARSAAERDEAMRRFVTAHPLAGRRRFGGRRSHRVRVDRVTGHCRPVRSARGRGSSVRQRCASSGKDRVQRVRNRAPRVEPAAAGQVGRAGHLVGEDGVEDADRGDAGCGGEQSLRVGRLGRPGPWPPRRPRPGDPGTSRRPGRPGSARRRGRATRSRSRQAAPRAGRPQVEHLGLDRDVQRRRRLVQHEQSRPGGQRSGDADPLRLPARELVGPPVEVDLGQAHLVEQRDTASPARARAAAVVRSGSPITSPTDRRGFIAATGFWNTRPMSRRTAATSPRSPLLDILPSERTCPEVGSHSRIRQRTSVVLPDRTRRRGR